mgnify:CR=1 FL=1
MGPDLRIAMRMGPPVIATGAPVMAPNVPTMGPAIPMPTPGQTAAANLQGYATGSIGAMRCRGCGPNGPSLRDVAPPSWISRMPTWLKWTGGVLGLGGLGLVIWMIARR